MNQREKDTTMTEPTENVTNTARANDTSPEQADDLEAMPAGQSHNRSDEVGDAVFVATGDRKSVV